MGVWGVSQREAIRIGLADAKNGAGTYFKAEPGEDIWSVIRKRADAWFEPDGRNPFHKLDLPPGHYYPRIARPNDQHTNDSPGMYPGEIADQDIIALGRGQLSVLTRLLDRICETIHPEKSNLQVFGHEIRNLLILACTEVETHWRGVLVANGVSKKRYSTNDYVKLISAMRLNEYSITLPSYPWLSPFSPFRTWGTTGKPTQELPWYDAYNAAKHDRELSMHRANLQHAFEAVCGCVIMMAAQFGWPSGLGYGTLIRKKLPNRGKPQMESKRDLHISLWIGKSVVASTLQFQ